MSAATRRSLLLESEDAATTIASVLGILALVLVPVGLFALLWMYLRRVAPEGTVPEAQADAVAAPAAAPAPRRMEDVTQQNVNCPRCGILVRPNLKGYETAECANCGAPIFTVLNRF